MGGEDGAGRGPGGSTPTTPALPVRTRRRQTRAAQWGRRRAHLRRSSRTLASQALSAANPAPLIPGGRQDPRTLGSRSRKGAESAVHGAQRRGSDEPHCGVVAPWAGRGCARERSLLGSPPRTGSRHRGMLKPARTTRAEEAVISASPTLVRGAERCAVGIPPSFRGQSRGAERERVVALAVALPLNSQHTYAH